MAEHFASILSLTLLNPVVFLSLAMKLYYGLLAVAILWGFWKLHKPGAQMSDRELKWAVLLIVLVIPFNLFVQFPLFDSSTLGLHGQPFRELCFLFGLVSSFAAVGLAGILPAGLLALAAGLIQTLILGQDPFIILAYLSICVLFIWQTSRTETIGSGKSKNSPLINGLIAFAAALPILLIHQIIFFFSRGDPYVWRILEGFLLEAATLFPTVLLAAAVSEALSRWKYADWNPFRSIVEHEVANPISQAVTQLEKLTLGQYDEALNVTPRSAGEAKFYAALDALRENLRLRNDTQARLLSLDPSYYSREAYDLLLTSILRAALGRDASSARLILFSSPLTSAQKEMRLRLGQGEQTRVYASLDTIILEKLGVQDELILSDIKDDQYFGASAGLPYPHALVALSLKNEEERLGVLWVGFEQNHWFSEDDLRFYQQLAYRASAALGTKEQAARMQNQKAWLEAAFQALPEPILILNGSDEVVFVNGAAQQVFTKQASGLPNNLKELETTFPAIAQSLSSPTSTTQPFRIVVDKNQEYEVKLLSLNTKGGLAGKVLLLNDADWQKRVAAQKSEFVTNISHDLLSPLQLMRGYVNLLKNIGNLSEEQQKYISRILLSIENMSGLVSKVMSMEMLDSNEEVKYAPFDVKDMIEEVVSTLSLQAQQRKVTLHTDFNSLRNPKMVADRTLLRQAVFNLVENAIKFNHLGGEVWISATKDAANLRIEVKDNGKGIAPLDQPKLFTRYFHIEDGENYDNLGPGLGLSIVKSVVEKHGGRITMQSKLGEGSTFTLEIPLKK